MIKGIISSRHHAGLNLLVGWSLGIMLALQPGSMLAARWTLIRYGANEASAVMPYPNWNELLRHPTYSRFVSPDGDPDHAGIACTDGISEGQTSYFGVRGTAPIHFQPGLKLIVGFYNQTDNYVYPAARISFSDADEPDPAQPGTPWHTLLNLDYEPEGQWVEPHTLFELSYYISNSNMVNAINGPPSMGDHFLVNVNLPYNDSSLVLTRIEFSDECDLLPPQTPQNLRAELFGATDGAGLNLVRLSWDPVLDNPTNATGISRYFIYRDGSLYDLVDKNTLALLGNKLHYVDLTVAPETTYEYRVSALDSAPFGLYPQGNRLHSRFGNESALSVPIRIRTPAWSSTNLINPWVDFEYSGCIRLPWTPSEDWSYAAEGLAYYPEGNPIYNDAAELPGSLYALTHVRSGIAEINIPAPVASSNFSDWPTARFLKPATNLWPQIYRGSSTPAGGTEDKVASLAFHPAANGISERLYYGVCNYYGTDAGAPSHGWFNLDLSQGYGAWFLGGLPPENVYPGIISRYLFAVPSDWAAAHTRGRSLLAGNTILSGGLENYNGPTLYAFAPWESGGLPVRGSALPATLLLRYSPIGQVSNRVINWSLDETAEGAAWLSIPGKTAIAISCRRTVGDVWYGDSLGNSHSAYDIPEPPFGYKGGCCTEWRNGLMLYNPNDLAAVARGEKQSWEPQPYVVYDTQQFSRRMTQEPPESGAITYAPNLKTLFYIEHNGDPEIVNGLIHTWRLPVKETIRLRWALSDQTCRISWNTIKDGRSYQLERTERLSAPVWAAASQPVSGDGLDHTATVNVSTNATAFFQVTVR